MAPVARLSPPPEVRSAPLSTVRRDRRLPLVLLVPGRARRPRPARPPHVLPADPRRRQVCPPPTPTPRGLEPPNAPGRERRLLCHCHCPPSGPASSAQLRPARHRHARAQPRPVRASPVASPNGRQGARRARADARRRRSLAPARVRCLPRHHHLHRHHHRHHHHHRPRTTTTSAPRRSTTTSLSATSAPRPSATSVLRRPRAGTRTARTPRPQARWPAT